MFVHCRSQGFILKKEDRGETNQLFTIYTKEFGKLEILAKAIRKTSSKLRSGMELFYLSEIEFIQGKTYKTLTDAILIEKFENIRKGLKKLSIAYKISELLNNLISGQEADKKIWQLLLETFTQLNNWKIKNSLKIIYYYFFWNFISILGYQPELYNCIFCQNKLMPKELFFSLKEGGVICHNCFEKTKISTEKIEPEVIKILRIILEKKWQTLSKLKIELKYIELLKLISKNSLSFLLEEK